MGPSCSSAETQVCHRSYIIAASPTCALMDSNVGRDKLITSVTSKEHKIYLLANFVLIINNEKKIIFERLFMQTCLNECKCTSVVYRFEAKSAVKPYFI